MKDKRLVVKLLFNINISTHKKKQYSRFTFQMQTAVLDFKHRMKSVNLEAEIEENLTNTISIADLFHNISLQYYFSSIKPYK